MTPQTMLSIHAEDYVLRPLSVEDALAVVDAVRESVATVGAWMTWASPSYSLEDVSTWIQACTKHRVDGTGHEFGVFASSTGSDSLLSVEVLPLRLSRRFATMRSSSSNSRELKSLPQFTTS